MFNPVASYRYMFLTVWLYATDIANTDMFCVVVGHGFVSTSNAFMRNSAGHTASLYGWYSHQKGKSDPSLLGTGVLTHFAQHPAITAVIAYDWNPYIY